MLSATSVSQPARILQILINLNPCLSESETLLLSYYKRVRATWSPSAIRTVQKATGLKLTNKLNRCRFAMAAAKFQLQWSQPEIEECKNNIYPKQLPLINYQISSELPKINSFPARVLDSFERNVADGNSDNCQASFSNESNNLSREQEQLDATLELTREQLQIAQEQIDKLSSQLKEKEQQLEQKKQKLEQSEKFSVLLLTNRLLPAGLPLNGTEESPAMRILGSPKTLTELEANYRELIKREHPDVSPFPSTEAIERFAYVRSLYRITREHWQQLKPTAVITETELKKRMIAPVPFAPESFWAA